MNLKKLDTVLFIAFPVCALVILAPMVLDTFHGRNSITNKNLFQLSYCLAWIAGWLAAPGYILSLFLDLKQIKPRQGIAIFIKLSIIVGIICSIYGLVSILVILPFPFALGSLVCSILLLKKFNREIGQNYK